MRMIALDGSWVFVFSFHSFAAFFQVQLCDVEKGLRGKGLFDVDRRYLL
jgi:hypothetical protein